MIAISYRRDDSLPITGRLYDRLQATFGKQNVFMDFDSIRPGLDFRDQIKKTIERSKLVVVMIGPNWVGQQPDVSRRIDDPSDFVRLEVSHALKRDIPIIPVLINNTPMPKEEKLPADIQGLVYRHALPLDSGLDFHQHADRLISGICDFVGVAPQPEQQTQFPGTATKSDRGRWRKALFVTSALVLLISAAAVRFAYQQNSDKARRTTSAEQAVLPTTNPSAPSASVAKVSKPVVELTTVPNGARVLRDGVAIGTTPLRRDDLSTGEATFVLVKEGYLPHEVKATIDPGKGFKEEISLARPAPLYGGTIRVRNDSSSPPRPLAIALDSDLKSGRMTQSSKRGDFVVKFNGVWEGPELHAVTGDVVLRPNGIQWSPESFTLRFAEDGKNASYECVAEGKIYVADLAGQSVPAGRGPSVYKGTIRKQGDAERAGVPLTIAFASDRKSGAETQASKYGDTIVKFSGVWDGKTLRAVTDEVVSKPQNIQWKPESFTLRFADDWKTASYECTADGQVFTAQLAGQ